MKNKLYTTTAIAILLASAVSLPAEAQRSVDRSTPLLHDVLTANTDHDPEPESAAVFVKIEDVDGESQNATPGVEPDEIDVQNSATNEGLEPDEIDARNTARSETRRTVRRPNRSKTMQQRRRSQATPVADEGLTVDADGDGAALLLPAVQAAREAAASGDTDTLDDLDEVIGSEGMATEDVDGDGDLDVDAQSELTIMREAAWASQGEEAAGTRVRRGMQELKN